MQIQERKNLRECLDRYVEEDMLDVSGCVG